MENTEVRNVSKKFTKRINLLFKAMTCVGIVVIADVFALIIFAVCCAAMNLRQTNPNGVLLGSVILMIFAIALVICLFCLLITATITSKKLNLAALKESENNNEQTVKENTVK